MTTSKRSFKRMTTIRKPVRKRTTVKTPKKVALGRLAKKQAKPKNLLPSGSFGTIYSQFQNKPKEAIRFLIKKREGECTNALFRDDIGYIDIVWGENDQNNKGFGLKHIIEKHGSEIEQLGFKIEDFIPIVVQFGEFKETSYTNRKVFESKMFRFIVATKFDGKHKQWLLTAFDLRKKPRKKSGLET